MIARFRVLYFNDYANRGKIKASPEESERETSEISTSGGNRGAKMRRVCFSSTDKARFIHRGLLSPSAIAWLRSCILSRVLQILILSVSSDEFRASGYLPQSPDFCPFVLSIKYSGFSISCSKVPLPESTFNLSSLDVNSNVR